MRMMEIRMIEYGFYLKTAASGSDAAVDFVPPLPILRFNAFKKA